MESFVHHSLRHIIARCDMGRLLNGAAVAPSIYVYNMYIDYIELLAALPESTESRNETFAGRVMV